MASLSKTLDFLNKEKGISFISILAIFVSFTLLSFIITFMVFSNTAINILQKQVQVRIFFKDTFSEEKILELKSQIEKDSRVSEVGFTSKEDALRIFKDLSKNDPVLQESLTSNILPASLEIRTKDVRDLDSFYEEYANKDFVESIKYLKDIKDRFIYYARIVTGVSLVITLLFFVVSFGIILSTIRINIFQKKEEIETMKLVGASDDFVERPFIHQGIVYSMAASVTSSFIFSILLLAAYFANFLGLKDIGQLYIFGNLKINYILFVLILIMFVNIVGYLFGRIGSKTAIQNYLKV